MGPNVDPSRNSTNRESPLESALLGRQQSSRNLRPPEASVSRSRLPSFSAAAAAAAAAPGTMKRQPAPQQRLFFRSMGRALAASISFGAFCFRANLIAVAAAAEALLLADEPFTLAEGSGFYWVKAADTREGHAAACLRNGFDPTPPDIFLPDQTLPALQAAELAEGAQTDGATSTTPRHASSDATTTPPPAEPLWSENLLTVVANGLGLELERPGGLAGCCVPGMWCGPRGCYTLAFGDTFSNYGGYVGVPPDDYSIYTCKEPSVPLVDPSTPAPAVNGSDPGDATAAAGNTTAAALPTLPPTAPTAAVEEEAGDGSPSPPVRPTIASVGPEVVRAGEALMVVGSGFGEAVSDVRVMVGGRDCRDPELCHLVCRPCGDEDRCEFDEMCMEDGLSKEKVCLPICDGTEGSCPCDHRCLPKRFELQGEPHSMVVNLCRPPDADPNFLCHGSVLREQERIQCTVPVLVWDQAETESSGRAGGGLGQEPSVRRGRHLDGDGRRGGGERVEGGGVVEGEEEEEEEEVEGAGAGELSAASFSLSVGDRGAVWEGSVEYAPRDCHSAEDCDDGDACSFDACVEGSCVHTGVQEGYGCQAQPVHATWRGDAYRYFQIVDRADPVEQAEFVAEVRAQNKLSSVTFADDYPVEFHNWREFPVYGTKYEDVYISPNGALFVPPLQTVVPGGLSAVSPSTEAYLPVLKADWNPSDSRAASSVLVMIEEDQFSVLYQDVFLFKRSSSATPSTFSTTVFPDGSLRYRYMRIGDKADWTAGVSGNSFVSPTIRNRHVRQSEFIQMDENGLPSAAAPSEVFPATPTPPPSPAAPASAAASNSSDSTSGDDASEEVQQQQQQQEDGGGSAVTIITNDDDGGDDAQEEEEEDADADTEVTLCRAPTLACLARACGKAGSEIPVLWEGVGCQAAASLNVTFSCRIGGLEVPAVSLEGGGTTPSSSSWRGGGFEEEAWGPDWVGGDGGGGLVCEVPRLEWVEAGQEEAAMVPVEVLWSLPEQASESAKEQVRLGAEGVAVHGLSVLGDAGLINSHVLAFRYYRDDAEPPDCGCSSSPRQTELTCDSCLVCGGDGSTKDCGGFCHGEASVSPCGECSGGMTGVTGGLWCEEYGEYLDGPAEAALLSLSQSVMMLVALSIMTAFLTMCLFLARALMLRGVLAMEGDRHGTLRRRVFSRHRGLSPSEVDCLETVEYSTAFAVVSKDKGNDKGNDDRGCTDASIDLVGDKTHPTSSRSSRSEEKGGGVESAGMMGGDDEAFGAQGAEEASPADCAICLGGFEEGDVLRKLPCLHFFHQKCVDEWLHLSVSCPLCKRSAREGLRRQRRRRRRARAAAEAAAAAAAQQAQQQQHRDSTVPATTATPIRTPTPAGAWFRGLPSSLARLFARPGDGGGGRGGGGREGRRQWQRIDDEGSDGEEKLDDDRGDTGNDDESPLDEETRRMRVVNANIAAFFGGAEPSPHVSPESLGNSNSSHGGSSSSSSSSDVGGEMEVDGRSSALRGLFGGNRFDGDGGRRRGRGGAAEYELAPIGPAAAAAAVDAEVTRNSDIV